MSKRRKKRPARARVAPGEELRRGEIPFAILNDKRFIMAGYRTTMESQGPGWDDEETTRWTLTLDGRTFEVIAENESDAWLPLGEDWAMLKWKPKRATPLGGGLRYTVTYHHYWAHHFGSISGDVTLTFDLTAMTVWVDADLEVDLD